MTPDAGGSAAPAVPAASTALLEVADAGRSFSGVVAVAHAGLTVQPAHIHGLIGPNGAGKTTLVNIISGHIRPDAGTVRLAGRDITRMRPELRARLGMARTFQDTRLLEGLTVRDNLWLGSDLRRRIRRGSDDQDASPAAEQDALLDLLGLNTRLDAVVGDLSSGERKAVEVGRALAAGAALILLDEPFSGLTSAEVDTMLATLRNIRTAGKCSMLLVEHNLGAVFDLCDTVTAMDRGTVLLSGATDEVRRSPAVKQAFFGDEVVADLGSSAQLSTEAATAALSAVAAASRREQAASAVTRPALEIRDLRAGYGRLNVVHGASLSVGRGEIVGLIGANGAGKTTLFRAIMGLATVNGGSVSVDGEQVRHGRADHVVAARIAFCTQTRDLFISLTVEDNLRLGARAVSGSNAATKQRLHDVLGMLPALTPFLRKEASALSGGQQQLLAVARALMSSPRVLLLDEPSTGLAVGTLSVLCESLRNLTADGLAVLVAEQNVSFASSVCSRGYVLENGQVAAEGAHDIFARAWEVTVTTTSTYPDAHPDPEAAIVPPARAH